MKFKGLISLVFLFSICISAISQTSNSRHETAKQEIENRNYEKAISILTELVKLEPNNHDLFFDLGIAYSAENNKDKAIESFEKSLQNNPQCVECYAKLAKIYFDKRDLLKTESTIVKGLAISNSCAELYYVQGLFNQNRHYIDNAFYDFTKAIALDPQNTDYLITRANLYIQSMNFSSAYSDISSAIKINPNNSQYYYYRAFILMNQNVIDEALIDIDKAIELKNNVADYHSLRFSILSMAQNFDEALKSVAKSIELNPNDYLAYMNMGDTYFQLGEFENYCKCYEDAINKIPSMRTNELDLLKNKHSKFCNKDQASYYYVRALGEFNKLNYDDAVKIANQGLAISNYSSVLNNIKGAALLAKKDYDQAKAALTKSIEFKNLLANEIINSYSMSISKENANILAASYNVKSYLGIAISELHNHNYEQALKNINEALFLANSLKNFDGIEYIYNVTAMIYLGMNNLKSAYDELNKAFLANNKNLVTNLNYANIKILEASEYSTNNLQFDYIEDIKSPRIIMPELKLSGKDNSAILLDEAWEQCELVLNKAPQNAIAFLLKAQISVLRNNLDEACLYAKKALSLGLSTTFKEVSIECK